MSILVPSRAIFTKSQVNPEDLAHSALVQARHDFKELVNSIYRVEEIAEGSDREITAFMHLFEDDRESFPIEQQEEIWEQFLTYQRAFEAYGGLFAEETTLSTQQSLREIDPTLVREARYLSEDRWIVQRIKPLFYAIVRATTSQTTIDRYLGRVEYLSTIEQSREETQKVIELFPLFFAPPRPLSTLQEIDDFLDRLAPINNPSLLARAQWFEAYLERQVNANLDVLFHRELTEPEEIIFYNCLDVFPEPPIEEEEEGLPLVIEAPAEEEVVPTNFWEGEMAQRAAEGLIRGVFQDLALIEIATGSLIPIERVVSVQQLDDPTLFRITFDVPSIIPAEWGGMTFRTTREETLTVRVDPLEQTITFPEGEMSIGVHVEDYSFLLDQAPGKAERTVLSTLLWWNNYLTRVGNTKEAMLLSATVMAIKVFGDGGVGMAVRVHDKQQVDLPLHGRYPNGSFLSQVQRELKLIKLTPEQFAKTF